MNYVKELKKTENFSEIFELVKQGVKKVLSLERSGLMLGLMDLGMKKNHFIGAFYPVGSNIIVINKTPLALVNENQPKLFKDYVFHLLLHEYLHTLGILDEKSTRIITFGISENLFGKNHPVTTMAKDFRQILPMLKYPEYGWNPSEQQNIEIVEGFDQSNTNYIC